MPRWERWFKTPEAEQEDLEAAESERQAEFQRSTGAAVPFIAQYRERLLRRSRTTRWKEGMTNEQAAANLIAQTVLLEMIEELDKMVREAKEESGGR